MTKSALFSIVTITKDNLGGLQATGKSLAVQTNRDFEWIVIDGGSHDGTKEFLKTAPCEWISKPDKSPYEAMNKGLERAGGAYILFLNAGDTLATPQTLDKISHTITAQEEIPDFIYGDALEGAQPHPHYKKARSHTAAALGMFTHHQAMLYARDTVRDMRYDTDYKIAADYDFTLRALRKSHHVLYVHEALCVFAPGGISQRNAALGRAEQFQIRKVLRVNNVVENAVIFTAQFALWGLRKMFPAVYWAIRKRR